MFCPSKELEEKMPWMRSYIVGLGFCLAAYVIVLGISIHLIKGVDLGVWRIPVGLAPAVPASLMILVYLRALNQMDEFTRHLHVRSILFAAAFTTVVSFFVAFFENAGLPYFRWHVWILMCGSWGMALGYNTRKYK